MLVDHAFECHIVDSFEEIGRYSVVGKCGVIEDNICI